MTPQAIDEPHVIFRALDQEVRRAQVPAALGHALRAPRHTRGRCGRQTETGAAGWGRGHIGEPAPRRSRAAARGAARPTADGDPDLDRELHPLDRPRGAEDEARIPRRRGQDRRGRFFPPHGELHLDRRGGPTLARPRRRRAADRARLRPDAGREESRGDIPKLPGLQHDRDDDAGREPLGGEVREPRRGGHPGQDQRRPHRLLEEQRELPQDRALRRLVRPGQDDDHVHAGVVGPTQRRYSSRRPRSDQGNRRSRMSGGSTP